MARSLGLATVVEWKVWCKEGMRPPKVPSMPDRTYKGGGWQGWGHWLGTGNVVARQQVDHCLPFNEALALARSLGQAGMASKKEWQVWCRNKTRPHNVHSHPDRVYKDGGWKGWGHWLGTDQRTKQFLPFGEALALARSLGLTGQRAWVAWCKEGKRPPTVPAAPNAVYKDGGWQGWGHWLGTGNQHTKQFLPFCEAIAVAQSLGLASKFGGKVWCKEGVRPPDVPSNPQATYKDGGWQGWGHWLGTGNHSTRATTPFLPFEEALPIARSLGLANQKEWGQWCKEGLRAPNVPSNPQRTYMDGGWQGWVRVPRKGG